MAMVPEDFVIQSAVGYFLHNWMCGLRPELAIKTLNDGRISIDVHVQSMPSSQPSHYTCSPPRKRSGQRSRKRRKERRAFNSTDMSSSTISAESMELKHSTTGVEESAPVKSSRNVSPTSLNHYEVDVNADFEVQVQQLPNLLSDSDSYHSIEFSNQSSSHSQKIIGSTYPEETAVEDLIQLDDSTPSQPSSSLFQESSILTSQPQSELMLYNLVRELYTRTCLMPNSFDMRNKTL